MIIECSNLCEIYMMHSYFITLKHVYMLNTKDSGRGKVSSYRQHKQCSLSIKNTKINILYILYPLEVINHNMLNHYIIILSDSIQNKGPLTEIFKAILGEKTFSEGCNMFWLIAFINTFPKGKETLILKKFFQKNIYLYEDLLNI